MFAKVKIEKVGKFECKNYKDFKILVEAIKVKEEGKR